MKHRQKEGEYLTWEDSGIYIIIYFLWASACVKECTHMWKSEESFQELVLLFYFEYWVSNSGIENYVAKSFIRALFEYWTEVYGLSLFPHRWIILFWLWYMKTVETLWHLFIHLPTEFSKGGESKRHRIKNQTDNTAWYLIC